MNQSVRIKDVYPKSHQGELVTLYEGSINN